MKVYILSILLRWSLGVMVATFGGWSLLPCRHMFDRHGRWRSATRTCLWRSYVYAAACLFTFDGRLAVFAVCRRHTPTVNFRFAANILLRRAHAVFRAYGFGYTIGLLVWPQKKRRITTVTTTVVNRVRWGRPVAGMSASQQTIQISLGNTATIKLPPSNRQVVTVI